MAVGTRPLVPSRLAPAKRVDGHLAGLGHGIRPAPRSVFGGYIALTKPRIIELLLITTLPAMVMAEQGWPPIRLIVATLIGGTLAAGGANAINMYIDRDIDGLMERTANRPLVTGLIAPRNALIFAFSLEVVAFAVLWIFTNLLAAVLAVSATAFYVVVYTIWLKRTSTQNIVIGGAAGAVPVLVGWAAVRDSLAWSPVVLFALIFFWTPPRQAVTRMVAYTVVLVACSLVLIPVGHLGATYIVSAAVLGAAFLAGVVDLGRNPTTARSMRVFGFSISYVTLLFVALTVDVLVRFGW